MPSNESDDEERGFRHVEALFHDIAKEGIYPLTKTQNRKQALCSYAERKDIIKYMRVKESYKINTKHIVLVDDVLTSGATIFSAAKLLEITNFEILVLLFNHHNYDLK